MTGLQRLSRQSFLACTALGCCIVMPTPAVAQVTDVVDIPTGAPRSPLLNGTTAFSQKLLMLEEFGLQPLPAQASGARLPVPSGCTNSPGASALDTFLRQPIATLPTEEANIQDQNPWLAKVNACLGLGLSTSPIEGRPPGRFFAHQRFQEFFPAVYFQSATAGARTNTGLRDSQQMHRYAAGTEFGPGGLYYSLNSGTSGPQGTTKGVAPRLHPKLPVQNANSLWTFDGTFPLKLVMARYGEPVLFRHYNALPISPTANRGFGINQLTTHHHNGHNPAESDGFAGAYFFPGQFYDYRWPMVLSGNDRLNTDASGPRAKTPDGLGGERGVAGDWRQTMSTHWFHDHRIDHTAENVYKGMAAMMNIYSGVDRGREGLNCHYADPQNNNNLCLPSGTYLDWGNRDYDVNLALADKAWNSKGQLYFNLFNTDGFLGDRIVVNMQFKPFMEVRPRRYRFRILNSSVSRYFKVAVVTAGGQRVPFHLIGNDGNLMEHAVRFPNAESQELPIQGTAERFDIIVDFSRYAQGTKIYLVNLAEHEDGRRPKKIADLSKAMKGESDDPGVGKFLEFRVVAPRPGSTDLSMKPEDYEPGKLAMVNLPEILPEELANAKRRTFTFGRSNGTDADPWTIKTDGGRGLTSKLERVSAAPTLGAVEIWTIRTEEEGDPTGWTHPVHIHFEEGQILTRDGLPPPIWERWARKDVFNTGRLASNEVEVALRFGDFLGTYMEHCHNTQHEDHAMLLRWDVNRPGDPMLIRAPLPDWGGVGYADSFLTSPDDRD
ncbi:multicopper oxidase family protein [Sphingomonas sp. GCM10030256]|uniref:multicopper oxidase family protein n=1 Tax=Sphingomonas sp. GCM10030256 TaxID=3273427 RepID=UPI00361C8C27